MLSPAEAGRNEHVEAIARYLLGRVALARGAVIEAEGHLHEAMAIAARRDFRPQTLNAVESLAHVAALMVGRFDYPHGHRNSPPSSVRVKDARNSTRS